MTDWLTANLEVLYERQPLLKAAGLDSAMQPFALEVLQTPAGYPTAKLQGTYLHSRYDPMKEARRSVGTISAPSAAIALGFGLGYSTEAFCDRHPDKPVVVIEEIPARFRQALASRDLRGLLTRTQISWCVGESVEAAVGRIESLPLQNLAILRLPGPRGARGSTYYRQIETMLASVFDRRKVNINTLRRFGDLWVRNLLSNVGLFISNPGIRAGEKRFTGVPAVVLAAGPSLEELLPYLEEIRQRCLIVAVDTSYRFCKYQRVEPDFLVTVDPQYWNSRHLTGFPGGQPCSSPSPRPTPGFFALAEVKRRDCTSYPPSFPLAPT